MTSPAVKLSPNARNRVRDSVGVGTGDGPVGREPPPQADSPRHAARRMMVPRRVKPLYLNVTLTDFEIGADGVEKQLGHPLVARLGRVQSIDANQRRGVRQHRGVEID